MLHSPVLTGLSGLCRVTEHLFVSNSRAANCASLVSGNNITCIINVSETKSNSPVVHGVEYIHIALSDSPSTPLVNHFDEVADKILHEARKGGRTLVHCNAGVSRSTTLCMAFLIKHQGATLMEAYTTVKNCRPMVRPNNGFWKQLIQYEAEHRGCTSVRMVSSSMGEIPDFYENEAKNMMPL
ncbi:dual specificity protein phosphatase 18-like [Corythoichthys intestinalis]|uniref:dual specificity protein phosphatase 18-like n=1 Tax=Corythoichthys intestinalis TaxID=161448 RepID=UPI0025A5FF1C|nr:dual specificity protein phosphatase 18-like [Corythoichthys intestinalis]XP_061803959.1 dual specificity protein phosphatase 18-like [Nerophis lumbriciformis]